MGTQNELFEEEASAGPAGADRPDPEIHHVKARLVDCVRAAMAARKMTQVVAAKTLGSNQPEMSRILRGHFREVSVERLMRMLTQLGCGVDIVVRAPGRPDPSVIRLAEAPSA